MLEPTPMPRSGSGPYRPRFNLFRHETLSDLLCAVPEDCPVPSFVTGSRWTFAGSVTEAAYGSVELNWPGVREDVRLIGFYLFHSIQDHKKLEESLDKVNASSDNILPFRLNTPRPPERSKASVNIASVSDRSRNDISRRSFPAQYGTDALSLFVQPPSHKHFL